MGPGQESAGTPCKGHTMARQFVRTPLDESFLGDAKKLSARLPIYPGSHRREEANLVGFIGEIVVTAWLKDRGITVRRVNEIGHDLEVLDHTGQRLRCDVKTKDRTVFPEPHHEATVPRYVFDEQVPDFYVFASLHRPWSGDKLGFTHADIVGWISRPRFEKECYLVPKGTQPNGARIWTEMFNVRIERLNEPADFLSERHCAAMDAGLAVTS